MTLGVWVVVVLAAALGLGAAIAVAGLLGLVLVASALFAVALLVVRLTVAAPRQAPRYREHTAPLPNAAFAAYRRIESDLFWASHSRRLFDHAVRPTILRLLAAALAERHRIDLSRDRQAARRLVGEELWRVLDPDKPAGGDEPGVDVGTLTAIVDRLEELTR